MFTTKLPLALALLLAASVTAQAQDAPAKLKTKTKGAGTAAAPTQTPPPPAPDGGPRPPRPGHGPDGGPGGPGGEHGPRGLHKGGAQALTDYPGTLTGYVAGGDDQVYDAFTFKTSTGTDTVRFPRHLGQSLMAAAKPGSAVTITGFRDTDPRGRQRLHLVSLASAGQTVRDTPPARPATPPTEQAATATGTVQSLSKDPKGHTRAAILSDGTVLHLPPAAAEQLADKLKAGATIAATGTLRQPAPGEVAARQVRVLRAQTVTLDGVQFLVR